MAYIAVCPVCKKEKFYDNSIHLYLQIKGEREYVCADCENVLKAHGKVSDSQDSRIYYRLETMNERPAYISYENRLGLKNHRTSGPGYFVQRITWTEMQ